MQSTELKELLKVAMSHLLAAAAHTDAMNWAIVSAHMEGAVNCCAQAMGQLNPGGIAPRRVRRVRASTRAAHLDEIVLRRGRMRRGRKEGAQESLT